MRIVGGFGVTLGGFDLQGLDPHGVSWKTNEIEDWLAPPGNTGQVVQNQFADGGWLTPSFMEPKVLRLVGRLYAADRAGARAAVARLSAALPVRGLVPLVVSEDGVVTHRLVRVEGAPKIPRPTDVYASYDLLLTSPDSRLFGGDGSTDFQHSGTAFLPSTSGGLQVLGAEVLRTNLATNPSAEVDVAGYSFSAGNAGVVEGARVTASPRFGIACAQATWTTASTGGSPGIQYQAAAASGVVGDVRSASAWVRTNQSKNISLLLRLRSGTANVSNTTGPTVSVPANTWTEIKCENSVATGSYDNIFLWALPVAPGNTFAVGDTLAMDGVQIATGPSVAGTYFDGSTPSTGSRTYAWTGAPNDSASTESSVGGLQAPFQIGATVVNGSVTVTASGDAPPPVLVRINGPVVQPIIRDELGGQMPLDISLSAGQWLDVDLDARTIKINSTVNRRNLLRGPWITPRSGMVLSLDAAVYNPDTSMTVHWTDANL